MKLHLSPDLALPIDAVTQTFGVLAKRGVGKTYTASVMAEELLKAKQQVVVADPIGVWHGLRTSADGRGPGLPIYVFGGESKARDLPLELGAGELIADVVVDQRISVVLDLSMFRKGQQTEFMTAFAERLYHRNREALHLFLDEADAFAPQKPMRGQERMLGAVEDLVRRGRARGLGITLITQRSAVLNKDVLTQIEVLVALRTISPQDRAAIDAWVQVHGTPEQREELMSSLPALPVGTAWFWSPGWPTQSGIFQRVQVRARSTYDSSATPKAGEPRIAPKAIADVDLEQLRVRMASTIERAKAEDPKALRARIRELEAQLKKTPAIAPKSQVVEKRVEILVLKDGQLARLEKSVAHLAAIGDRFVNYGTYLVGIAEATRKSMSALSAVPSTGSRSDTPVRSPRQAGAVSAGHIDGTAVRAASHERVREPARIAKGITSRQQRFLDAAATLEALGVDATRETVSGWLGVHPRGGSVGEELKALAWAGLIRLDRGRIAVTAAGRESAGEIPAEEAVMRAKHGLSPRQRRIFEIIEGAYPEAISREAIAERMVNERTGKSIHPRGGSFGEDLGRLRGRGLIDYARGQARMRDYLLMGASR